VNFFTVKPRQSGSYSFFQTLGNVYEPSFYFRILELQGPDGKRTVPQLIWSVFAQTLIKTLLIHFDFRSKVTL